MKIAFAPLKFFTLPPAREIWVLRMFMLCLLWGGGLFLWGSTAAYLSYKSIAAEQQTLQQHLLEIEPWLTTRLQPMQDLSTDKRLLMGLNLPGGLASAPVTRLLYEFSYNNRLPEVYIIDTNSKTINKTAGAGALGNEIVERLTQFSSTQPSLLAAGILRGTAYLVQPVPAPLPQKVLLVVPISLENWSSVWPNPETLHQTENESTPPPSKNSSPQLGLLLAHTSGWAWWQAHTRSFQLLEGAPLNFPLNGTFTPPNQQHVLTLNPLTTLSNAAIGMPSAAASSTLWLNLFFIFAILAGTTALLWQPTQKVRHKIQQQAATYAAPMLKAFAPVVLPLEALFNKAKAATQAAAQNLSAAAAEPALISGPGAFDASDFQTGSSRSGTKPKPRYIPKPATSSTPEIAPTPESPTNTPADEQATTEKEKATLTEQVLKALETNRISLLYQPIFRTDDGKPVMHEVFARLLNDEGNLITPAQFLPITQENGLNPKLDASVFRKILSNHFAPGVVPATPLALNIAATSLEGMNYLTELTRHGPSVLRHLAFEVRSQEVVRDANAIKLLKDLQANGGHLAVDYFGGGQTMLQASKAMGFNYVRFDAMRFATESAKTELAELCKAAKNIGLPVILERIETPEMQNFARQIGVSYLQGYGLAKPADKMTTEPLKPKA